MYGGDSHKDQEKVDEPCFSRSEPNSKGPTAKKKAC